MKCANLVETNAANELDCDWDGNIKYSNLSPNSLICQRFQGEPAFMNHKGRIHRINHAAAWVKSGGLERTSL